MVFTCRSEHVLRGTGKCRLVTTQGDTLLISAVLKGGRLKGAAMRAIPNEMPAKFSKYLCAPAVTRPYA